MVWTSPCKPWEQCSAKEQIALRYCWAHGDLRYKLDPLQLQVRAKIDEYFSRFENSSNPYARFYALDMSRRLGKDFITLCYSAEQLARVKDGIYLYGTAFYKQLVEILEPLLRIILQDCPPDLRLTELKYKHRWEHPVTGSVMKMVGLDKEPDSMRGPRCDGVVLTEVPYCDGFEDAEAAFLPQLLDNPNGWRIYGSSAGKNMAHKWETEIVPEATITGNISHHILDESPRYSSEQIEAAYDELGGRNSHEARREFQCLHEIPKDNALIPEWIDVRDECIVESYPRPEVAHGYLGLDPGMSDLTGIPAGYLDFEKDMLVIERAEAESQLNTEQIANLTNEIEKDLGWEKFGYYTPDGRWHPNPYKRVSDRDPRLIADLNEQYRLVFEPAEKHDMLTGLSMLRTRIARKKLRVVVPGAQRLVTHLDSAIWNKQRTAPERTNSKLLGHYDLVMALVYLNRSIDRAVNPFNPIVRYPLNMAVVQPYEQPKTSWTYKRDEMGDIIQ